MLSLIEPEWERQLGVEIVEFPCSRTVSELGRVIGVAGHFTAGKKAVIERNGHEFVLPGGHTVELEEVALEDRTETWVQLRTPLQVRRSIFRK